MGLSAVLTGDIVNSTKLTKAGEKTLLKMLTDLLQPYKFEFYRGDSFQVFSKKAHEALRIALLCRSAAISLQNGKQMPDIRIAIGIGEVNTPIRTLGSAKGEAFVLSGRSLDEIQKTETRLAIVCISELGHLGCQIISEYVNSIYRDMTPKQAEVVLHLLKGENQQNIAELLNKSKSTISQLVSSARWGEIEKILDIYNKIIDRLS